MLVLGLGSAQWLWLSLDSTKLFAWLAGMAAPFCYMCAASVWAMRDKIGDAFEIDAMSSAQYQSAMALAARFRRRSTSWAALCAVCGLSSSSAAVSDQLVGAVWQWQVLLIGTSLPTVVYAYMLASMWDEQIRAFRSKKHFESKKRGEIDAAIAEMGAQQKAAVADPSWSEGPSLEVIKGTSH